MDNFNKDMMEVEFEHSTVDNSLLNSDNSNIPSMIIEELDENAISSMNMDINEFVEVKTLQIQEVKEFIPKYKLIPTCNSKDVKDMEDQDVLLTADEEHQLTRQFLNGELTFSEYSSRMDQDIDLDITENDIRNNIKTECETVLTIADQKSQKASNVQQVRQKRKRRTLPTALQGLMGEANLRFAKGEASLAEQICMEIIRQVPSAPEPFQTLAMIYESDQPEKSLQFALIAAHLSPKNADQWIRLANQSLDANNIKQAITCYSKAIQANPKDVNLYETRAELQVLNGDKKAYIRTYTKLINQLESEDSEHIIRYAKVLIKHYIQEDNTEMALEVMEMVFDKCSNEITLEEVNIMTELLIVSKQFQRCLSILIKYTDIEIQYKDNKKQENTVDNEETNQNIQEIESCNVPDNVAVDLKAKCIITLIELYYIRIADEIVSRFLTLENPEISGDLFLDIAETFMGKKEYQRALVLLEPLLKSPKFSLAAVWLRHAECWVGCDDIDKAIHSYEVVRTLSPQHLDARLALANLYKKKQLYDNAIEVLYQDPECDELDPDVIYQRTLLLYKVGRYKEYFSSGMLLFSRHCINIRRKNELNSLARAAGVRQRLENLQLRRLNCGEKLDDENTPTFIANEKPSEQKEFQLFLQMCNQAFQLKKYGFLQRLSFTALTSKRFNKKRNSHILFLCLLSCIHNHDSFYGYNIVREFVRVCHRPNVWNLLNIIIQRAEDLRHNRFIMRLLGRDDIFSYLHIMHANNCLVSGTYKYALNSYVSLFKVAPSALLALLIGVTQMQMACQRIASNKAPLVIQALAFFKKYAELRGKEGEQEANYNMARAFHQLGLLPSAIHFYKLVLDEEPSDLVKQHANLLDLRKEAAFNLHLIYLQSDNHLLARTYLENYITI